MEHCAPGEKASKHIGSTRYSCPLCHGTLIRTQRRPVDRLRSLFTPVQRYRCDRFTCQWVGNIHVGRIDVYPLASPSQKNHMLTLLNILLLAVLVLLVLLTAVSASMSGHPTADVDPKEILPAGDNDWTGDGIAEGLPSFPMQAPSTPK